jgi:glycosyltransferase involved in cell wall biosynthesis
VTTGTPLVSVVIPTYNRAAFLAEAIQSALAQTFTDLELIVVDDGSTDHTAAMVRSINDPRVHLVSVRHSGLPARGRNAGVERARGRYIAFLDSDDLWDSSKLDDQLAALAERPDCRWCHTGGRCIDEVGAPHPQWPNARLASEGWILEALFRRHEGINTSSVLVDRALLLEVGGFDETFVRGEDYDLWVRLAMRSPIACVRNARVGRRIHATAQFVGTGRERLRTLVRMARSAPSWRLRSLAARESVKVAAAYVSWRARGVLRRILRRRTGPLSAARG